MRVSCLDSVEREERAVEVRDMFGDGKKKILLDDGTELAKVNVGMTKFYPHKVPRGNRTLDILVEIALYAPRHTDGIFLTA